MSFELLRPFLRPIEELLLDHDVSEIMGNPNGTWYVEREGEMLRQTDVCFDPASLRTGLEVIANNLGKRLDEDNPVVEARLFGYGQSMGALILLRSLAAENRFCAVAVDSCPVSLLETGCDLIGRSVRLGSWFGRSFGRVAIQSAMLYSRLRYGVDLTDASAEIGLGRTGVPVLLIRGTTDRKVSPRHVSRLSSCARIAEVWNVPGAGHSAAIDTDSFEYERRLVNWYTQPQQSLPSHITELRAGDIVSSSSA